MKIHIGMRKVKSLVALAVTFILWQGIRIFLPMLETHPVFAYIYSVIEIRDTSEKTKKFSKLRIKATLIGLAVGLIFITLSVFVKNAIEGETLKILAEFLLVSVATLISLMAAEGAKCETFCGIAAIITIICMISHNEQDIYLYAIMRVIQTLIGIFSALVINVFIKKREKVK